CLGDSQSPGRAHHRDLCGAAGGRCYCDPRGAYHRPYPPGRGRGWSHHRGSSRDSDPRAADLAGSVAGHWYRGAVHRPGGFSHSLAADGRVFWRRGHRYSHAAGCPSHRHATCPSRPHGRTAAGAARYRRRHSRRDLAIGSHDNACGLHRRYRARPLYLLRAENPQLCRDARRSRAGHRGRDYPRTHPRYLPTLRAPRRHSCFTQPLRINPMFATKRFTVLTAFAATSAFALTACGTDSSPLDDDSATTGEEAIVVGSQDYYSNEIIAEIYAQALENADYEVDRQFRIGQREAYLPEIESGEIDLFPEYSGPVLQY